jgi:hypothetical protein
MKMPILLFLLVTIQTHVVSQNEAMHDLLHVNGSVYAIRVDHLKFGNPSIVTSIGIGGVFLADVGPQGFEETQLNMLKELGNHHNKYNCYHPSSRRSYRRVGVFF